MAFTFYDSLLFSSSSGLSPTADGYKQVSADNGYFATYMPGTKPLYAGQWGIPQGGQSIVDTSSWNSNHTITINEQGIRDRVAQAYDNGYDISWDLESLGYLAEPGAPGVTEEQIDYILDTFEEIYAIGKSHRPQVLTGFYMHPTIRSYYLPVNYRNAPSDPTALANYNTWIANMQRKNKRWTGSEYITKNFSDYCDIFFPDTYVFFKDDPNMEYYINENVARTVEIFANGKPVMPFMLMHYHDGDKYIGIGLRAEEMGRYIRFQKEAGASGIVMWGGGFASMNSIDFKSTTSKNLAQWQAVTNGCFQVRLANSPFLVKGIDCSASHPNGAVASMADVATRITVAIAYGLHNGFNPPRTEYPPGIYGVLGEPNWFYTLELGPCTVTHDGTHFVFNSAGGVSSGPYGTVRPPDIDRQQVSIRDYLYSLPDPSGNGWFVPPGGTDLVPGGFLSEFVSSSFTARSGDEWSDGWGYGAPWHVAYKSAVDNENAIPESVSFTRTSSGGLQLSW